MLKNLLILWNPFIEIEAICKLCLLIDSKIYTFFAKLYAFYIDLAGRRIFSNEAIQSLSNRLYIFIGIIALFIVTYTLLKAIVDPDKGLKEGGGKLVFKIVTSLIMISLIPVIFELGYKVQEIIVNENIVGKIFLGGSLNVDENVKQSVEYNLKDTNDTMQETESNDISYTQEQLSQEILKVYGNQTAYIVLSAFLYPLDENFTVKASDYFNLENGIKASAICAGVAITGVAAVAIVLEVVTAPASGLASLAGIPATLKAYAGAMALAGVLGGATGAGINMVGYAFDAEHFRWSDAQIGMVYGGNFDYITAFSGAIEDGKMEYVPIISTICGAILVYLMIGFCLDLGIRAAKLAMFEMLAPIPILLRIIPGQDKIFNSWIQNVISTFFEIIIRIGILFGVSYLISLVPTMTVFSDSGGGAFAKCFIVLGLVAFIKEAPKLLSDVIGIKGAGNIKFGLKDKLAATGALAVGAAIGAGTTSFLRNGAAGAVNAFKYAKNGEKKKAWKALGTGTLSAFAGGFSGAVRGGKAGLNAKNYADVKNAASSGIKGSTDAREKRLKYKSSHGDGTFLGNLRGVAVGHIEDGISKAIGFAGIQNLDEIKRENAYMAEVTSSREALDSTAESIILKELAKGKNGIALGSLGADLDFTRLKQLKEDLDRSKQTGVGLQAAQEAYDRELKNLVFGLEDATLKSTREWEAQTAEIRAKLAAVRTDAVKFKVVMRSNSGLAALENNGINGASFAEDVSYTLSKETWVDAAGNTVPRGTAGAVLKIVNNDQIDHMERDIKIRKGDNDIQIAAREKKEEESKK